MLNVSIVSHFIVLYPVKNPVCVQFLCCLVIIVLSNCFQVQILLFILLVLFLVFAVSCVVLLCKEERLCPTSICSLHISQRRFYSFLCFIGSFLKQCKMSSHGTMPENNETTAYNQKCNFLHNSELVLQKQLKHWNMPYRSVLSISVIVMVSAFC